MKRIFLASALMLMGYFIIAQEVQWASTVLDFSTQLSEYQYSATQVLGKPDVLPDYGDNPNAWLPSRPNRTSFVKVGFEQPMLVRQIAIGESFNPGALYQVFLYDENDREYLLNTFIPRELNVEGRLLNIYLSETEYAVSAVKIVLDGSQVPGYNGIDAIGISGSTVPITAERQIAFRRNPGLENQFLSLGAGEDVSELRPVYVKSLNTMYFTRAYSPQNIGGMDDPGDIWQSLYDETSGRFQEGVSLGDGINDIGYNSTNDVIYVNGNLSLLLGNISGKSKTAAKNVIMTTRTDGEWGDVEELKIQNSRIASIDADYTIVPEDSIIILSTLRYDTEGERDLYIIKRLKGNRWSEPENMGGNINTTLDEYSPYYSESERSLYFASNGYPGFGGSDIFRITRIGDSWTNWTTPENLGGDINTDTDENYFFFDDADEYAFFTRMNVDSTFGIIRVERPVFLEKTPMVTLQGNVINKETDRPLNSVISVLILPEERTFGMTISDQTTGAYEIMVPSGNKFILLSEKEGFEIFETSLALENRNTEYTYNLDIEMGLGVLVPDEVIVATDMPPEKPEVRPGPVADTERTSSDAYDITFDFNSDKITEESYPVIDLLVEFLESNPDMDIELAGFTDHIGSEKYNNELALKRASAVKKYMVDKGIKSNRIAVLGFGERMTAVYGVDDEKDLRMNRRVEYNFTK
jgi:outer membrane protein OmpA-like peptidoglycan-associated protein